MQESTENKATIKIDELFAKVKTAVTEYANLLKTKEGRNALGAKVKVAATSAKDKIVALWKSGVKGKVILCAVAALVLWIVWPSGDDSESKIKSSSIVLKKVKNTEKLWYEGSLPDGLEWEQEYKVGNYTSVVPNLIIIPKCISFSILCGSFNPELEERRVKGVSYLNDPDSIYYAVVVHVGNGYVIVRPESTSMYGHYYGYIYTDDEYVEGARLKFGFYTYLGTTKTVPMANGSSHTMYAFRKLEDKIAQEIRSATEYNAKACEAANKENRRREREYKEQKAEMDQRFSEHFDEGVNQIFSKALASYDETEWMSHIHISKSLKGKIKISDVSRWQWKSNGETEEMTFASFKRKLEKEGGAKYWKDNALYVDTFKGPKESAIEAANRVFKSRKYQLDVKGNDETKFICYKIEFDASGYYSIISANTHTESDMTFQLYDDTEPYAKLNVQVHYYIIDPKTDGEIKDEYDDTGNNIETAKTVMKLFEKKYGK